MKVQDVKREGPAIVGLSVELSNSEIGSIDRILWTVDNAISTGINQAIAIAKANGQQYNLEDEIPVAIDLKSLRKLQWLLYQLTRVNRSDLFHEATREFESDVNAINNAIKTK